ncbi:hypothetical protein Barb6_01411 [Bacteroidales bacterium Barb6]|nr:hypothetical protein Barb6_01411 [Bacteroidales bacterium Barb6]
MFYLKKSTWQQARDGKVSQMKQGQTVKQFSAETCDDEDDEYFSPVMQARMKEAILQIERGEGVRVHSHEEMLKLLDSL